MASATLSRGGWAAGLVGGTVILGGLILWSMPRLAPGESRVVVSASALASPLASHAPAAKPPIHLNTATTRQLRELPGVGELQAQRIVDARPFRSVDQLAAVKGMTPVHYQAIKRLVIP